MKKSALNVVFSFAVIALLASSASAGVLPYVGVQFTGNGGSGLGSGTTAGLIPQANFNVEGGQSGGPNGLMNAGGNPTPVSLTWVADDQYHTGTSTAGPNGAGDPTMLSGEDKTRGTATYTLANVPAGIYDLVIYTVNDIHNEGSTSITVGSTAGPTTLFNVDQSGSDWNASGTYHNGGSTTSSTSLTPGNYIEFFNVSPDALGNLAFTHSFAKGIDSDTVAFNGFQLASVPEPSSLILCGLGALGLFAAARRRRKA